MSSAEAQSQFTIVSSYLSSTLSLKEAVERLTAPITEACMQKEEETSKNALKSLWTAILDAAKSHTLDSPAQKALVALLRDLKSATEPSASENSAKLLNSLSLFNETAREHWARTWRNATCAEWTNLNSFLARASKSKIVTGLEDLGLSNTRSALETRQDSEELLDAILAGAGVWIVVMGDDLLDFMLKSTEEESKKTGVHERWQFWKTRFSFMSHRADLSLSSRELAAEAAAVMHRVV